MTTENFNKAIEIISASNSCRVQFNTPVTDNYSNVHQILIKRSNATVLNQLFEAGYHFYMTKKGLSVEKH